MTAVLLVLAGVVGLAVSPWANLVADRAPAGLSLTGPGPACGTCATSRQLGENLVARSWVLSQGRCGRCGGRVAIRGPAVDVLMTLSFVLAALRLGWSWSLPPVLAAFAGMLALAACDLEHHLLPRRIVYSTGFAVSCLLVLAAGADGGWKRLGVAALCGLAAFGLAYLVHAINPRWLGFGDVRLSALIGLVLGWFGPLLAWIGLLVADVLGLAVMVVLMAVGRARRDTAFPFGVFLVAGAVTVVLV